MTPVRLNLPVFSQIRGVQRPGIFKERFKEPEVEFWPDVVLSWKLALENCPRNLDSAYHHPDSKLMRGFALLDPYVLSKTTPAADTSLAAWLFIRSPWISYIATRWTAQDPFPGTQDWRTYVAHVAAKIGYVWGTRTSSGSLADKPLPPSLAKKFPLCLPSSSSNVDLYWRGQVVVTADELQSGRIGISDKTHREIIYDLYEQNFRVELLCLDRMQVFRGYMTQEAADVRDQYVIAMFPRHDIVTSALPDECLGARHTRVRATHVDRLRQIMASWGGACSRFSDEEYKIRPDTSEEDISRIESRIFAMYCDQFFKFFYRAPTIPHIFPSVR